MTRRTLVAVLFLFPCLLLVRPMPAGEQPDKPKQTPAQKPSLASVERGLAEMEAKLAQMTKEVQGLRGELKTLTAAGATTPMIQSIKVWRLNHLNSVQLARTMETFLEGRAIRIIPDPQTNSLLVQGDEDHLNVAEALVSKLENLAAEKPAAKQNGEEKPR
jgi:hypothetical protein